MGSDSSAIDGTLDREADPLDPASREVRAVPDDIFFEHVLTKIVEIADAVDPLYPPSDPRRAQSLAARLAEEIEIRAGGAGAFSEGSSRTRRAPSAESKWSADVAAESPPAEHGRWLALATSQRAIEAARSLRDLPGNALWLGRSYAEVHTIQNRLPKVIKALGIDFDDQMKAGFARIAELLEPEQARPSRTADPSAAQREIIRLIPAIERRARQMHLSLEGVSANRMGNHTLALHMTALAHESRYAMDRGPGSALPNVWSTAAAAQRAREAIATLDECAPEPASLVLMYGEALALREGLDGLGPAHEMGGR